MGIESFFFNIIIEENIKEELFLEYIRDNFDTKPFYLTQTYLFFKKKKILDNNKLVINNTLVLDSTNNNSCLNVTIEGCFANYENNIIKSFYIYKSLKDKYKKVILKYFNITKDIEITDHSLDIFTKWLKSTHEDKYNHFICKYGDIKFEVLPNDFYRLIKKLRR